jgi:phosphogluconate dehydratase
MGEDKEDLAAFKCGNLGIVTAYNDMLSAHQPYETYPNIIKQAARDAGGTAQVAGGVPAMCDGVTQGQPGMELSLFSRDVIAMASGVALSHNTFDAAMFLGVCDKIVPGLVIAAATFGHLPSVFVPAGPMPTGISNDEKNQTRQLYAEGKVDRKALLASEMASYHGAGTCTFYGTANTNQMLMEIMGLHLPGSSFVSPNTPLREALTATAAKRALQITKLGNEYIPAGEILDAKTYVNGMVGLMATGGSTNLTIHLLAMARASGIILTWDDLADISATIPLLARVYPNGLADVNHMHAAGGIGYMIGELLNAGLLHDDTQTIMGSGLSEYTKEPKLIDGALKFVEGTDVSLNDKILRPASDPFQPTGGLSCMRGNLGTGVMKVSAVKREHQTVTAPVRVFQEQYEVKDAFKAGEFTEDTIVVVRFQGSNGMPELHNLTPVLSILMGRGLKVALVTDGRMSGASGKVPSAIQVSPEAACGGPLAYLRDGDIVTVDGQTGKLFAHDDTIFERDPVTPDLSHNTTGMGRELFEVFRQSVGTADQGASSFGLLRNAQN